MRPSSPLDLLERLAVDSGQRTIGQLLQEREWARVEILRLRRELADLERRRVSIKAQSSSLGLKPASGVVDPQPATIAGLDRLVRSSEVVALVGVTRRTVDRWIAAGAFPAPVQMGRRAVGWRSSELAAWQAGLRDASGIAGQAPALE